MKRLTTIELIKERMSFAAGHFTIFSATERERLHGHSFSIGATITAELPSDDLAFDYAIYKNKLYQLCDSLHEYFLLPERSPHLKISEEGDYYHVIFDQDKLFFLKKDVKLMPVANMTIEALSYWFLEQLTKDQKELDHYLIETFTVRAYSSPGQCAMASWERSHD